MFGMYDYSNCKRFAEKFLRTRWITWFALLVCSKLYCFNVLLFTHPWFVLVSSRLFNRARSLSRCLREINDIFWNNGWLWLPHSKSHASRSSGKEVQQHSDHNASLVLRSFAVAFSKILESFCFFLFFYLSHVCILIRPSMCFFYNSFRFIFVFHNHKLQKKNQTRKTRIAKQKSCRLYRKKCIYISLRMLLVSLCWSSLW